MSFTRGLPGRGGASGAMTVAAASPRASGTAGRRSSTTGRSGSGASASHAKPWSVTS
nr:MAG TPA: hypothetical protein [Caudoviricetes sp.]